MKWRQSEDTARKRNLPGHWTVRCSDSSNPYTNGGTGLPKPARGTGAGLVGFDKDAFCSYGFDQSFNAPVSIKASKAYLAAIQYLSRQEDHWLSIGPAWLCFLGREDGSRFQPPRPLANSDRIREPSESSWLRLGAGFEQTAQSSLNVSSLLRSLPPARESSSKTGFKSRSRTQRRIFESGLLIYSLCHTAAATIYKMTDHPCRSINLRAPQSSRKSDGRFDRDKLNPDLIAALYRAALKNDSPPITLLKPLLDRLKSNVVKNGLKSLYDQSRFALLKLTLNRQLRNEGKLRNASTSVRNRRPGL